MSWAQEELIDFERREVEGCIVLLQKEKYGCFRVTVLDTPDPDGTRRVIKQTTGIPFWSYAMDIFDLDVREILDEDD